METPRKRDLSYVVSRKQWVNRIVGRVLVCINIIMEITGARYADATGRRALTP